MKAKIEFIEHTKDLPKVVCAELEDVYYSSRQKGKKWTLYEGYTEEEYEEFLESIDFTYDDGYGSQELGGVIWYEDGTYSDRYEYDGSESWDYHKAPEKPTQTPETIVGGKE